MRNLRNALFLLPLFLLSCSSDSEDSAVVTPPAYAMTAKLNGATFEANNPFGTNMFSSTNLWSYYDLADYVMLQGRQGGAFGNPEINIWLRRTQIVVGTYAVTTDINNPTTHAIDLIDNSNSQSENTVSGTIAITEVNTTTKVVKGTFQFTSSDDAGAPVPVINFNVTDGTFNYKYEN